MSAFEIHYATTNKGKVRSLERALKGYDIYDIRVIVEYKLVLPEPRSDDVGLIACEKVRFAYDRIRKLTVASDAPTVASDAGCYIYSLNGFPKAFVNFALETIGLEGILRLVEGKNRECEIVSCLAYLDERLEQPLQFISRIKGRIANEARGKIGEYHWSQLSQIFIPDGSQKTRAEMTDGEYLDWRRIAREKESEARLFLE